jgi:outer membrane protein assembly factor BamE (lipoprotein component of BamABCDE complex)
MKRFTRSLAALAAVSVLSGCVIVAGDHEWNHDDWEDQQQHNREAIARLDIGMERMTVLDRLGSPNFSEAYTRDGDEYRVLFFRTQHRHSDGDTTKDETTPLVFRNDKLIGWGDEAYATHR